MSNTDHLPFGDQHHSATRRLEQLAKLTGGYDIRAAKCDPRKNDHLKNGNNNDRIETRKLAEL